MFRSESTSIRIRFCDGFCEDSLLQELAAESLKGTGGLIGALLATPGCAKDNLVGISQDAACQEARPTDNLPEKRHPVGRSSR
jgi:hypothetical protein